MELDIAPELVKTVQERWKNNTHTIALFNRRDENDRTVNYFQWHDNLGNSFSPEFTDLQEAFAYPHKIGLKLQP